MTSDAGMTFEEGNGGMAGVDKVKAVSKTVSKHKSTSAKEVLANINPDAKSLGNIPDITLAKERFNTTKDDFGEDQFKLLSRTTIYDKAIYESDEISFWKNILDTYIKYDPETGLFTWHTPINKKFNVGDTVGTSEEGQYINIKFSGRQIHAHRLAFIDMVGYLPQIVDHIDRSKDNTTWNNLREADYSLNAFNADKRANNSSGVPGVHFDNKRQKWVVTIGVRNKSIWLGYFEQYNEAVETRLQAEKEYQSDIYSVAKCIRETKAMDVGTGCVIQVTTQQRTAQGYVIAEAVTFVPNVKIYETIEKYKVTGRVLKGKR